MKPPSVFDRNVREYDAWFEAHPLVYAAELRAVRACLPPGRGLEVGVGSGRFAAPLGIKLGLDVSLPMLDQAKGRGVAALQARAEHLPVRDGALDFLLMVTVLCFVADPLAALIEARRVVVGQGRLILAFLDRLSPLGVLYDHQRQSSKFYCQARFFSVEELLSLLRRAGFNDFDIRQTIRGDINSLLPEEPVLPGWGQGIFVVVTAR